MIIVEKSTKSIEEIKKDRLNAVIVDVRESSQCLNPVYPYGDIPVPFDSGGMKACCVEAVWEGLKVFEHIGVDPNVFDNFYRRTPELCGKFIGFQRGVYGHDIMSVEEAYKSIYFRTYRWMLENHAMELVNNLRACENAGECVVLLDDSVNDDIRNVSLDIKLSYTDLLKAYVSGLPPYEDAFEVVEYREYRTNGRRDWDVVRWVRRPKKVKSKFCSFPRQTEIDFGL